MNRENNNNTENTEEQNVSSEIISPDTESVETVLPDTEDTSENTAVLSKDEQKRKDRAVKKAKKELSQENEPFRWKKEIFEWVYTIAIAFAVAFLIKAFIFDIVKVDGNSMFPTLHHQDRLIVTKLGYEPKQGDIIILDSTYKKREEYKEEFKQMNDGKMSIADEISFNFNLPKRLKKKYYVKRIIALPGQTVDIKNGKVFVDGKQLDEPYYSGVTNLLDTDMPVTVDENCVFVMGDNRQHSTDSRAQSLGQVPYKAILGKSQFRILPVSDIGVTK